VPAKSQKDVWQKSRRLYAPLAGIRREVNVAEELDKAKNWHTELESEVAFFNLGVSEEIQQ